MQGLLLSGAFVEISTPHGTTLHAEVSFSYEPAVELKYRPGPHDVGGHHFRTADVRVLAHALLGMCEEAERQHR